MEALGWQGWLTIGVIGAMLVALVRGIAGPDLVLMGGLFILATAGVLTPTETFAGFASPAMMTVGALFILSAAMRETGALELTLGRLFGSARSERAGLARALPPLAGLSAFLNNAPIVAMMTPLVIDWARRHGIAPSRLLIPLSYSTILGSIITVIGTSVILTADGLVRQAGLEPLGFFELAPVGVPVAVLGLGYLLLLAPRLLPSRSDPAAEVGERTREYTVTMRVEPDCALVGQDIERAGLRHLPGLFLFEIERDGTGISPVAPEEVVRADDRLVFAGAVSTIVDLQRIRGLVPVADDEGSWRPDPRHPLVEAVLSRSSPLANRTLRQADFRRVYDAAVIAVHRNGERVTGKIGDIIMRAGDTLLIQGAPGFLRAHRNSADFYLVSEIPESAPPRHDRAWFAAGVFLAMVALAATGLLAISVGAFVAGGILIATRCISGAGARRSVQLHVLVVIGAGLGIASAIEKTGAATAIAGLVVEQARALGPLGILATIYLVTNLMSELLHHNASVALMFPIAVAAAGQVGVDPRPFAIAVTLGASCAFASPVSYQTHLLVYGPGGYRYTDFVRVGLPLNALCAVIAIALIPRLWSF
ncbi:MAG: SLC13 family permease [Myxococcota bacterium]|nr:SLC13 family permease [Myxococcota bacterium]